MLRSLNSGVSALQQFQQEMDVIGNNIANVNTVGFKGAQVNFADALSQNLSITGSGASTQVGTGVTTQSIVNQFAQGSINPTGKDNDLAISGNGFFLVRDPISGASYATRAGDFSLDGSGYLITNQGMRVQGYSDSGLTTVGDILIDNNNGATPTPTSGVKKWTFGADGKIGVVLSDGTTFTRGQILLQNFTSPQSLVKEGNNLYSNMAASGPLAQVSAPNTSGLGTLVGMSLEGSNVDLANEFTTMITAQRAFEAGSKVITTSDEMLQVLVNLKR